MYKTGRDWKRTAEMVAGDIVTALRESGCPDAYSEVDVWDGMKVASVYEGRGNGRGHMFNGRRWEDLACNLMAAQDLWFTAWNAGKDVGEDMAREA